MGNLFCSEKKRTGGVANGDGHGLALLLDLLGVRVAQSGVVLEVLVNEIREK